MDLSPTVWKTVGAASVVGASLVVVSPSGRVMSSGTSNVFTPPMAGTVSLDIPLFDNIFEWGVYQFRVTLDEGGGQTQTIEATFNLCAPGDNGSNAGKQCIEYQADCEDGVIRIYAGLTKYNGFLPLSWSDNYNYYYPQAAGMTPINILRFPVEIGIISGTGQIAGYSIGYFDCGNNFFVTAQFDAAQDIYAYCVFPCHIWCAYEQLIDAVENGDPDTPEYATLYDKLSSVEHYVIAVSFGYKCGKDTSRYIKMLEDLLGVTGTCAPVLIGTTAGTTTTTTQGTTTTTSTGTTTTTAGTTTTTTAGTTTTTTSALTCPAVMDIVATLGGTPILSNIYFGGNGTGSVPNEATIQASSSSGQDPNGTINVDWTSIGVPSYLWFAIPAPITKTAWFASVFSNGAIGTPDDLFGAPTVVNVAGQDFNVYISNYQTQFTQICQIS